jgi:hypothetical protein
MSKKLAASRAKYIAAYQRKNSEKIAARKAAYYQDHPEKAAAYYQKNRKKILKMAATRYQKKRKKILKQNAAYYQKNSEKITKQRVARSVKYRLGMTWRHGCLLARHKRQLAPRGIKGQPMSLRAHQKKLYYADGRERPCWYCLGENNKSGSGLDRLDNNKTYTVKNTVPACRGCNVWRGHTHSVQETRDHFKPMRDAVSKVI